MVSLPTRTPRTIGLDWPLVRVAMVWAPAGDDAQAVEDRDRGCEARCMIFHRNAPG